MLQKRQGTKLQSSFVFYDKAVQVAQMHQGQSLTEVEASTVRGNVQFDISVHSAGVLTLIGEARRWLPRLIEENPERFGLPERFLTGQPQPTVWWLERTIWVLSHTKTKDRSRHSFGSSLVPKMLREVLRLDRIAGFTADNLEGLLRQTDKVVAAWRKIDCVEDDWAGLLAQAAKCSKKWVYERRKALLAFCSIDIALPFAFYRDLVFFGPNSLTRPEDRAALNAALARGDAATNLRLRQQAAKDFDRVRVDVVGAAVKSPPLLMSPKVAVDQMVDEQEEERGVGQPAKQLAPKKIRIKITLHRIGPSRREGWCCSDGVHCDKHTISAS